MKEGLEATVEEDVDEMEAFIVAAQTVKEVLVRQLREN